LVIVNQKNQETNYVLATSDVNNGIVIQNTDLLLSSGKQTSLYLVHDKEYLLINIWASWCEPCIEEVPDLIKLSTNPKINVLGLNVNDTKSAASNYINKLGIDYPLVIEEANVSKITNQFTWSGIPTSILINKQGKVIVTIYGEVKEKKIVSFLNSLSNE